MKKLLCLLLVALTVLALFTGCSGTMYSDYGYRNGGNGGNGSTSGRSDSGNVSTSRDGTVNGRKSTARSGSGMPYADMGVDMEIGK